MSKQGRSLEAEYIDCTTEEQRLEDGARIEQRIQRAREKRAFHKYDEENHVIEGTFDEASARSAITWDIMDSRVRWASRG